MLAKTKRTIINANNVIKKLIKLNEISQLMSFWRFVGHPCYFCVDRKDWMIALFKITIEIKMIKLKVGKLLRGILFEKKKKMNNGL